MSNEIVYTVEEALATLARVSEPDVIHDPIIRAAVFLCCGTLHEYHRNNIRESVDVAAATDSGVAIMSNTESDSVTLPCPMTLDYLTDLITPYPIDGRHIEFMNLYNALFNEKRS